MAHVYEPRHPILCRMVFVNEKEVRVLGLSRSGLHAFIEWILQQAEGRHLFLNSTEGKADPFTTARPIGPHEEGPPWQSNDPSLVPGALEDARHRHRDLLLVSHEDSFLGHAFSPWYEAHHDALVGPSRERRDIVLLRDPFNLFASRIYGGVGDVSSRIALRIWRQHARTGVNRPRRPLPRPPLVVSYNRWCGDRAYRERVAAAIGIPFTDAGRGRVPGTFGGSSFDGTGYDGKADQMRIYERWRHLADEDGYRALFDPATIELALERFGDGPGGAEVRAAAEALSRPGRPLSASTSDATAAPAVE